MTTSTTPVPVEAATVHEAMQALTDGVFYEDYDKAGEYLRAIRNALAAAPQPVQGIEAEELARLIRTGMENNSIPAKERSLAVANRILSRLTPITAGEGEDATPYKDALHDLVMLRAQQDIGCVPAPTSEQWAKAWAEAEELTRIEP